MPIDRGKIGNVVMFEEHFGTPLNPDSKATFEKFNVKVQKHLKKIQKQIKKYEVELPTLDWNNYYHQLM